MKIKTNIIILFEKTLELQQVQQEICALQNENLNQNGSKLNSTAVDK